MYMYVPVLVHVCDRHCETEGRIEIAHEDAEVVDMNVHASKFDL